MDDPIERNPAPAVLGVAAASSPADAVERMRAMPAGLPEVTPDDRVRREFEEAVAAWLLAMVRPPFLEGADA